MPIEARYHEQVRLLVSLLPFLNDEPCFALKRGRAINPLVMRGVSPIYLRGDVAGQRSRERRDATGRKGGGGHAHSSSWRH